MRLALHKSIGRDKKEFCPSIKFDELPLTTRPLIMNERIIRMAMIRNRNNNSSGSMSLFSTLHSASPSTSSSDSSSNSDTESTGSFIHDNNNGDTLGSLIGVSSILELYKRSVRRAKTEVLLKRKKKGKKSKSSSWLLCLRSRSINRDTDENNHSPSLGQFLALERRRAARENRENQMPLITAEPNSVKSALGHGNNWFDSFTKAFSCLCGQATRAAA